MNPSLRHTLALLIFAGSTAAAHAANVLDISDATLTPSLIMPESAETDTRAMLENWYLQHYAIIDTDEDSAEGPEFSEEVLMDRLSRLPVVIEMPYNSVVSNSIRFYARKRQLVENMLGLSIYYMPIFEAALERHGLPRELKYLPVVESALVPDARSRAGAGGLWQFMPATGTGYGLEQNSLVDMRFEPYASSEAAAKYLKQLHSTFGDWSLAIAAYNCGPGNINKALRRAGEGKHDFWDIYPFLLPETRGYFPAFIAVNYIMTYHRDHGISPALARRPLVTDTVHVRRRVHFDQIAEVMDIPIEELRALNPQYRRDIIPGDIRPYPLTLPSLQAYAYLANEDSIVNHNASRYARRGRVEPAGSGTAGRDARGEYTEEEIVQWHTVRRGETLSAIASRYGTTVRAIRNLNNCGKNVRAGRRLKIKTTVRRYREPEPAQPVLAADTTATAPVDSTAMAATATPADSTAAGEVTAAFAAAEIPTDPAAETAPAATAPEPRTERAEPARAAREEPRRPRRHKVRRGENLSKIANRYGITVAALKRANNLTSDRIQVGQRLVIPQ